jgi:hypothetical protein
VGGTGGREGHVDIYTYADGIQRIKPKIAFHGRPEGRIKLHKGRLDDLGVSVKLNETAYNNGEPFK